MMQPTYKLKHPSSLMELFAMSILTGAAMASTPRRRAVLDPLSPLPVPCGSPGEPCCPKGTFLANDDRQCFGPARCLAGVCLSCGGPGEACCDDDLCGTAFFGPPLSCNDNNICVLSCGLSGTACCTDADFATIADVNDYDFGLVPGAAPVADAPFNFGRGGFDNIRGCFVGSNCGSEDICVPRDEADVDSSTFSDYSTCGRRGNACCPEPEETTAADAQDDSYDVICEDDYLIPGESCIEGTCTACGGPGRICCADRKCFSFRNVVECSEGNVCETVCGLTGQVCCPPEVTSDGRIPDCSDLFATCIDGTCTPCGDLNGMCCPEGEGAAKIPLLFPGSTPASATAPSPVAAAPSPFSGYEYDYECIGTYTACDKATNTCLEPCGTDGLSCCSVNYFLYFDGCDDPSQCRADGTCGECGFEGQACCGEFLGLASYPCVGENSRCENDICVDTLPSDYRSSCGDYRQPCCEGVGSECIQRMTCLENMCEDCGFAAGIPCCAGGNCARDALCMDGVCGQPRCGEIGQPCCERGVSIFEPGVKRCEFGGVCMDGMCVECGRVDEPCCQSGYRYGPNECSGVYLGDDYTEYTQPECEAGICVVPGGIGISVPPPPATSPPPSVTSPVPGVDGPDPMPEMVVGERMPRPPRAPRGVQE